MTLSFSPKSFLKARRPERFSDTTTQENLELDRSLLEFQLSSLTSRGQETDFEHFARHLCEREICPNLLPQTGPTGGGDSKVDSETYPVADLLSFAWYSGLGREAANDRWAFAFSAKADWQSKVRSDIAKIANVKRGYTKAFFVTNQAVPDRKRAEIEDQLRTKHDIDVRILDRTWILDRIFKGGHQDLAISQLQVTGLSRREQIRGPLDVQRSNELEAIEKRIQEALQKSQIGTALVEDALDAADHARALERPRAEVQGRYARADQLAQRYGSSRQQVEAAYQWAWTLYWWYEDYTAFIEQYSVVENRVRGSRNAYDLERLFTLWFTIHALNRREVIDAMSDVYQQHTATLVAELERLSKEEDRPSTALQAKTALLEIQLAQKLFASKPVDAILRSLRDVVLESQGLVGYPLEPLVEQLTEIGQLLEGKDGYDELFETIVQVTSTRDGDVRAARLLLARGEHQIAQERPLDAIATLGRALGRLYKHETRHDIVRALYLCGCAYDKVGLPWAARGTLLAAASIATDEFWRYGDITPYQAACYRQLKWIELGLGRLPQLLAWHQLDLAVRAELVKRGYDQEKLESTESTFETLLLRLLLRTDFFDLKPLQALPDMLDQLGLDLAADGLLYILGHPLRLEEDAQGLGENPDVLASNCYNLRADAPLAERPLLYNQRTVSLHSHVLGCQIRVESKTEAPCVEVAESILAALESFLATSVLERGVACEPELTMEVTTSDFAAELINATVEEQAGRPHIRVRCRKFDPHALSVEEQAKLQEAILQTVITTISQTVLFRDVERDLETLFRDERVSERAIAFTSTIGKQANVLGVSPKTHLASWITEDATIFPLQRATPWQPIDTQEPNSQDNITEPLLSTQEAEPPSENAKPRSHKEVQTVSLIRERLWNRAGWQGSVFATDPANQHPPVFGLIFSNQEAGREIFANWRAELGQVDKRELLRLAIVRGIDKEHPHAYRVVVGSNPTVFPTGNRFVAFFSRVHRMDAVTPNNLSRFLNAHNAVGAFLLAPAFAPANFDGSQAPSLDMALSIAIHQVYTRDAWEIGKNDIDSVAIQPDDNPIIPEGVWDAPVLTIIGGSNISG